MSIINTQTIGKQRTMSLSKRVKVTQKRYDHTWMKDTVPHVTNVAVNNIYDGCKPVLTIHDINEMCA